MPVEEPRLIIECDECGADGTLEALRDTNNTLYEDGIDSLIDYYCLLREGDDAPCQLIVKQAGQ